MQPPSVRRTQQQRSEATRAKLLDATLGCLSDLGYAATTTMAVGERAGVSRGALLHHFPTRATLITAAIENLFKQLDERFQKSFARISQDSDRIDSAINLLWKVYASPEVPPLLELFVAARTDAGLRSGLEPVAIEHRKQLMHVAGEYILGGQPSPAFEASLSLCFDAIQGMAMRRIIQPRAVNETLGQIKQLLHETLD